MTNSPRRSWLTITWLLALVLAVAGFIFARRYLSPPPEVVIETKERPNVPVPAELDRTDLHILNFYSGQPVIKKGEKAILCYGVLNASKVQITPAAEPVSPSMNRCIEVKPTGRTTYRLVATSATGETREAETTIEVR